MKKPLFPLALLVVAALAAVGALLTPPASDAQGFVPANISGRVTHRTTGAGLAGRTATAQCSSGIFGSATYTATTNANGDYTIAAQGVLANTRCTVKISPCSGSNPLQRTVSIPPDVSGVNFGCSS
jgi:hypothetical protein